MRNCLSDKRYFSCRWSSDYGYREMYSLHGMHPYLYGTGENSSASITAENGTDAWCLKGCQKQKWSVLIRRSSIPKDSSICYLRMNDKIIAVIGYKETSSWTKSLRDGLPRLWRSFSLHFNKKQWKPSPTSSIVKSPQPTIKQDRHPHCLW